MRNHLAFAVCAAVLLWAPSALPCGGPFGAQFAGSQKIVVSLKGGVETYFFSPHFCGTAAHFGLTLPVPGALTSNPVLGDPDTVRELESITAPAVVWQTLCYGQFLGGDAGGVSGGDAGGGDESGAQVIDKGQVGMFDWSLVKADTVQAFTDWLNANQYPYDPSASGPFAYYVSQSFYFVAFKVTADSQDPPDGSVLCGDLGPIQLAFPSTSLVVPARIAAAASSDGGAPEYLGWRVFTIANHEMGTNGVERFSGTLSSTDLSNNPAVAKLASAGDRLTEVEVDFSPWQLTTDLVFQPATTDTDFRRTSVAYTYVACDAGTVGAAEAGADGSDDAAVVDDANGALVDASLDAGARPAPARSGCACSAIPSQNPAPWAPLIGVLPGIIALRMRRRVG